MSQVRSGEASVNGCRIGTVTETMGALAVDRGRGMPIGPDDRYARSPVRELVRPALILPP